MHAHFPDVIKLIEYVPIYDLFFLVEVFVAHYGNPHSEQMFFFSEEVKSETDSLVNFFRAVTLIVKVLICSTVKFNLMFGKTTKIRLVV